MKIFILSVMILYINFEVYKEMEKVIDNVNVKANKKLSDNEIKNYIHQVMKLDKGILTMLDISIDNNPIPLIKSSPIPAISALQRLGHFVSFFIPRQLQILLFPLKPNQNVIYYVSVPSKFAYF